MKLGISDHEDLFPGVKPWKRNGILFILDFTRSSLDQL